MATLSANNYGKMIAVPMEQIPAGHVSGKQRIAYDEITLAAELAVNDIINVCAPLPANALIIGAVVVSPSLGTTGILDLGISSDQNYFVDQADAGGAAVKKEMASEAGLLVASANILQPQLKCTEASTAGTGKKIQVLIKYVLE
jgi:hypothetical protein